MKAEILDSALHHTSYQNENRLATKQIEKEKRNQFWDIRYYNYYLMLIFTTFSNDYTRHK